MLIQVNRNSEERSVWSDNDRQRTARSSAKLR